jgi:competence protein ComEA
MVVVAALLLIPLVCTNRMGQDNPPRTVFSVISGSSVTVTVSGEVVHAGVYNVPANSMADSVIKMAILKQAAKPYSCDTSAKRPLVDGSAVSLTQQQDGSLLLAVTRMTTAQRIVLGIPLEIATMNQADFERLPGIGPSLARRIILRRQNYGGNFTVEKLLEVEGIGEKKYQRILPLFQPYDSKREMVN